MSLKKIFLILAALLLSACSGANSSVTRVTVTMTEFGFEPNTIEVQAGIPVELTLVNNGAIEHDFVVEIIPVTDVSTTSGDPVQYDLHAATSARETSILTFTVTQPGTYQFICSVPGHKDAGMTGKLIVK